MAVSFTPADFLGPVAALVLALSAIAFLARILLDYIAHLKKSLDIALVGWQAQTDATNRLADALEAEQAERAMRHRLADDRR